MSGLKIFSLLLLLSFSSIIIGQNDTLVIKRITKPIDNYTIDFCVFNTIGSVDSSSSIITTSPGMNKNFTIINLDSVPHNFTIDGVFSSSLVQPNDTINFNLTLNEGTYRYYSNTPQGTHLGCSGIIRSGLDGTYNFYWNLFDTEEAQNNAISNGTQDTIAIPYTPEVFTINNNIYPATSLDSLATIAGNVGDSIVISIVNSGYMTHPFHFHGYHIKIIDATINQKMIGWTKDSFPVLPGEAMSVILIPDKPGVFPVHDHNLISVTTGGYPGGMIATISIQP